MMRAPDDTGAGKGNFYWVAMLRCYNIPSSTATSGQDWVRTLAA
jgi:hypothetical protein